MAILNIKDFPDDLHRQAKAEAALNGISLKELIIRSLTETLKKKEKPESLSAASEKSTGMSRRLL